MKSACTRSKLLVSTRSPMTGRTDQSGVRASIPVLGEAPILIQQRLTAVLPDRMTCGCPHGGETVSVLRTLTVAHGGCRGPDDANHAQYVRGRLPARPSPDGIVVDGCHRCIGVDRCHRCVCVDGRRRRVSIDARSRSVSVDPPGGSQRTHAAPERRRTRAEPEHKRTRAALRSRNSRRDTRNNHTLTQRYFPRRLTLRPASTQRPAYAWQHSFSLFQACKSATWRAGRHLGATLVISPGFYSAAAFKW